MSKKKLAIFCHGGLGDGVVSTILSNNFHQNNWDTTTYHDTMVHLQSWFPHLPFLSYPKQNKIIEILEEYDLIVVFQNDTHEFVIELIEEGKRRFPEKIRVIYPYPTKSIFRHTYYNDSKINPELSIVNNLYLFCKNVIRLNKTTKNNGMIPPRDVRFKKHPKRVVFHVSSSRKGKNWPIEKYVRLAERLLEDGFEVAIIAGIAQDQQSFLFLQKKGLILPQCKTLSDLAKYLYESGYFIGNDSGLGHLASSMGLDTITIARRKAVGLFWRPGWGNNEYVTPMRLIPNLSGLRIRDMYWKHFISSYKVYRRFRKLLSRTSSSV